MSLFGGHEVLEDRCIVVGGNTLLGEIEMGMTSSSVSSVSLLEAFIN